jgi:putative endonuclease
MTREIQPAVYILASRYRGTLYVGVTSDLYNRVANHKAEAFDGFTKQYGVKLLVWYAHFSSMEEAIRREKQIKAWKRQWKFELVESKNKDWIDLHERIEWNLEASGTKAGPQLSLG